MAAVSPKIRFGIPDTVLAWSPILVGLLCMYVPTGIDVSRTFWVQEDESHGPVILAIVVWLVWRERRALLDSSSGASPIGGAICLAFALMVYIVGRSQQFFQFDVGSVIPLLVGLALLFSGRPGFKRIWFPALFTLFLIPVPPSVLDQILVPLKATVSEVVANGLFDLGYPVARTGVILQVAQYQLLIADACSGLKSMVALSGIGLLWVYLARHRLWVLNLILLASAVPIAFLANVLRVAALALVTYYFGDTWGRNFHDYAGYLEILVAFGMFYLLDSILVQVGKALSASNVAMRAKPAAAPRDGESFSRAARLGPRVGIAMVAASGIAVAMAPTHFIVEPGSPLEVMVPTRFAGWENMTSPLEQVSLIATKDGQPDPMQLVYDDSLLRTYTREDGAQIMIALAYDKSQREEDRVHRPEICYISQGFRILSDNEALFSVRDAAGQPIVGRRMLTQRGTRLEAVSYWIRIGDTYTQNPWVSRFYVLKEGLLGRVHDGMLVRVSQIVSRQGDVEQSFREQDHFLDELTRALAPDEARIVARDVS
ncbi:MAG: exosortase C-terminal domain/associated protein EpsI [Burkholderiaceae bacterium]|jgi:exosortase B